MLTWLTSMKIIKVWDIFKHYTRKNILNKMEKRHVAGKCKK